MNMEIPKIATLVERFMAYLIDVVILTMTVLILISFTKDLQFIVINITSIAIGCAYHTYFTSSSWQATIGQRLMKIYVATQTQKK